MSAGKPIQRGTIDIEIARRAAALLEQGERIKLMLFPFDEVVIDANSQEIIDVKKEVEQKMEYQTVAWGKAHVTKEISGKTPRNMSGATEGFVLLSDMKTLPWGTAGERGGIYTWDEDMSWTLKAGYYVLLFSLRT